MVASQYGCPKEPPTIADPNPEQTVAPGQQVRMRCEFLPPASRLPLCSFLSQCPLTVQRRSGIRLRESACARRRAVPSPTIHDPSA